MKHWLVIWSSFEETNLKRHPECIRSASADTAKDAMLQCWGMVAGNMSAIQCTLYELRTNKRRLLKIDELVRFHNQKMKKMNDEDRAKGWKD